MPCRAVDNRDEGQDLPFQDEFNQALLGPIGRVGYKPIGAQAETRRRAVQHREGGAHLGLPDRSGRLYINDDPVIGIDQVIV
tara:strand:- start:335 stop:580 length:246 start_codon:yes stop_codon:yes gene_type:complete